MATQRAQPLTAQAAQAAPPPAQHVADADPARLAQSQAEWGRLRRRILAISPAGVGRGLLTLATIAFALTLVVGTWPALVPFLLGAVIAYAVLPAVDRLDRIMPRWLAAMLCVLAVVAALVAVVVTILPPLALGVVRLVSELPSRDQIDHSIADISTWLGSFPEGRTVLVPVLNDAVAVIRDNLQSATGNSGAITESVLRTVIGAAGAALTGVLALIVLPSWILSATSADRKNRKALEAKIATVIRPDVLAIARIADRIAAAYLRGFMVTAIAVATLTYLGVRVSEQLGVSQAPQALPVAVFAGVTQLVPDIGPIVGYLPALLLLPVAPDRALAYVVIYIVARALSGRLIGDRVMEPALNVHPAILVPAIVALSNLGPVWLFAAAPVISIVADVVRYLHGRLSDPPKPAGVLPHETPKALPTPLVPGTARVPVAYRAMSSR